MGRLHSTSASRLAPLPRLAAVFPAGGPCSSEMAALACMREGARKQDCHGDCRAGSSLQLPSSALQPPHLATVRRPSVWLPMTLHLRCSVPLAAARLSRGMFPQIHGPCRAGSPVPGWHRTVSIWTSGQVAVLAAARPTSQPSHAASSGRWPRFLKARFARRHRRLWLTRQGTPSPLKAHECHLCSNIHCYSDPDSWKPELDRNCIHF